MIHLYQRRKRASCNSDRIGSVRRDGRADGIELSRVERGRRSEILKAREAVWRAWFANDTKTLQKLVPPDTIVISAGEDKWKTQAEVFQSAADFQRKVESLFDWSSRGPRFSASGRS
jgi:hypothetical protein